MARSIYFVGDPGPARNEILQTLRDAGLNPRRLEPDDDMVTNLESDPPVALIMGNEVPDRGQLIARIRDKEALHGFPVIFRLPTRTDSSIEAALEEGADDFLLDDCPHQLEALINILEDSDSWNVMRAPKGLAVLAEDHREERIRIAHVLKRNGFDVAYAGSTEELSRAVLANKPRIVVSCAHIAEEVFGASDLLDRKIINKDVPWIVLNNGEIAPPEPGDVPAHFPTISLVNKRDGVDGITFVTNELLTPAPPNVRKSKRLLYGAPVSFGTELGDLSFQGYCYNINLGGLFVRTLTPMPMGARVKVRMRTPFGDGDFVATAQVVWVSKFRGMGSGSSPPGMGVQFSEWSPPDKAAYEVGYELLLARSENRQAAGKMDVDLAGELETTMPPPRWWSPDIIV